MVDAAKEQMDYFCQVMEKRGIIVDRVEVHPTFLEGRMVSTPDWSLPNVRGTNNPRDLFLPIGNEIMEAPGTMRSRWYEYLNLRPIFERYFKEDPEFLWTAAPKPRLTDESFVKSYYYMLNNVWTDGEKRKRVHEWTYQMTEKEPVWDAADAARCGKDVFWQRSSVVNRAGMDWLKRYFGPKGIRIHPIQFDSLLAAYHPWHIDTTLLPLRPGLAVHNPAKPILTEEALKLFQMNDWEIVEGAQPTHWYDMKLNVFGEAREGVSWISMNTFSLGPNTVCVEAHELRYIDQLTKLGIEVVEIPYDQVVPFGGALHCTTLDVYREGSCEDYFPKQVPGY